MIYAVTDEDMGPFKEAGHTFFEECDLVGDFDFDFFKKCWKTLIDQGMGRVWVLENSDGKPVGAIGGVAMPDMLTGEMIVTGSFWYVLPNHRGARASVQLMGVLETWAKELGASRLIMGNLRTHKEKRCEDFYTAMGFEPMEMHYWKNI